MKSFLILLCLFSFNTIASTYSDLQRLQKAYPNWIRSIAEDHIVWADGSVMAVKQANADPEHPTLLDQLHDQTYVSGIPHDSSAYRPQSDPGRIRYEPFFLKMYGQNEDEIKKNLVTIYWLEGIFAHAYPLEVTRLNGIDQKLIKISHQLEKLVAIHPEYLAYLNNPGGAFYWRSIANTARLSPHSFGIAIDINADRSDYWQWDLLKQKLPISENTFPLIYQNHVPWDIVPIFEAQGFIWGGKWAHYDSMHFEYRPEVIAGSTGST